jgi:hypothetical protein
MIAWYWLVAWIVSLLLLDALYEIRRNKDERFWVGERDNWNRERRSLLDRIQAPSLAVYKALDTVPVQVKEPKPEKEAVEQI